MYKNVGKKIKALAVAVAWIGIVICCIAGIFRLVIAGQMDAYNDYEGTEQAIEILSGLGIMMIGSLVSWILSWFMYGFGVLIETNQKIVKNTKPAYENGIDPEEINEIKLKVLEDVYYNEEINYDTYVKIKSELTGEAQSRTNEYNVSIKFAYDLYQKGAITANSYNLMIKELKRDYGIE